MIRKSIIWIAVMLLLSTSLMTVIDIERAPSVEGVVAELLKNPAFGEMAESEIFEPYTELYSLGVKEMKILKSTNGTAREIAVLEMSRRQSDHYAIEMLQKRQADLINKFEGNEQELARIGDSRIIRYDNFMIFAVCDSNDTAEDIVHKYFKRR